MSKDLFIEMVVPVPKQLVFHKWLPLENDDFIVVNEGNISLTFWFTMDCWFTVKDWDREDIPNMVNINVLVILASVKIKDVPNDLADFILHSDYARRSPTNYTQEENLIQEYERLGERLYLLTVERLNRLLSYVRSEKGQYWLEDYPIEPRRMGYYFSRFKARVKTKNSSEWILWRPTLTDTIQSQLPDETRLIDRNDWMQVREFVSSSGKPDLVGELLAGAEALANSGHRRGALTEAMTALEVAISRFSRSPDADSEFGSLFAGRLGLDSLKGQISRLGLTATLNYLFPLIFPEDQLPTEILRSCQEANTQRQNVVHEGQRDVDERKLNLYLRAIRQMCSTLDKYSHA